MTNVENAKKTPAASPQPSAATSVSAKRSPSISSSRQPATGDAFHTPVAAVSRA
jgi:hypothetical protein